MKRLLTLFTLLILIAQAASADAVKSTGNYQYDNQSRLTSVKEQHTSFTYEVQYSYDELGNRTLKVISGMNIITQLMDGNSYCAGSQVNVGYLIGNNILFSADNVFTAQLSDANGSFANPIVIGTLTSSTAGTISAQIPKNIPYGTKYRIRVISSKPAFIGSDNLFDITLTPLPTAVIKGDTAACARHFSTYFVQHQDGVANKWSATGADSISDPTQDVVVVKWGSGTYGKLKLVRTDIQSGCSDSSEMDVKIQDSPVADFSGSLVACENGVFDYTAITVGGIKTKWTATGGVIIGSDSSAVVSVRWFSVGKGTLKLVQINSTTGCSDSITKTIMINPLPKPSITGPTDVCAKSIVVYHTPPATGQMQWYITGGIALSPTNLDSIVVQWIGPDSGFIKLMEITLEGCRDSSIRKINIHPLPPVDITGTFSVCAKATYTYTTTDTSSNYIYLWSAQNGDIVGTTSGITVDIKWTDTVASGKIKLIKINAVTGCKDSIEKDIQINPVPSLKITGDTVACAGTMSVYEVADEPSISNVWHIIGGTLFSDTVNSKVIVQWDNPGNGTVQLVRTNTVTGCSDSITLNIIIYTKPKVEFTGDSEVCGNSEHVYTATNKSDFYKWTITNGTAIGSDSSDVITVEWNNEGTGVIKLLQSTTQGCKDSAELTVTILRMPNKNIIGDSIVCVSTEKTYTSESGADVQKKWFAVNGTIVGDSVLDDVTIQWGDKEGMGQVVLIVTMTSNPCVDTLVKYIKIKSVPHPVITGPTEVCQNNSYFYQVQGDSDLAQTWIIENGKIIGDSTGSKIQIFWDTPGTGSIKIFQNVKVAGCGDSATLAINIHPVPPADIIGDSIVCFNTQVVYESIDTGVVFQWIVTNGTVIGPSDQSKITVAWGNDSSGIVKLYETSTFGCTDSSTVYVKMKEIPQPFIIGETVVCSNNDIVYSTAPKPGVNNLWRADGGRIVGSATGDVVHVVWETPGVDKIVLIQTVNGSHCADSAFLNVTVSPTPTPVVTGNDKVCEFFKEYYSVDDMNNVIRKWTVQRGTIIGSDTASVIVVQWLNRGNGSLKVVQIDTTTGCTDSVVMPIKIFEQPHAVIYGNDTVCARNLYYYRCSDFEGDIEWIVENGTIIGPNNTPLVSILWSDSAYGKIRLIQTVNSDCLDSAVKYIIIKESPTPHIVGDTATCIKTPRKYSCTRKSYERNRWDIVGGEITEGTPSSDEITVKWSAPGQGLVMLTQMNTITMCTMVDTMKVNVYPVPKAFITGDTDVCENNIYTYEASAEPYLINKWYITGGTILSNPFAGKISVIWDTHDQAASLRVVQMAVSDDCADSVGMNINIHRLPKPGIAGESKACANILSEYRAMEIDASYQWTVENGLIIGDSSHYNVIVKWDETPTGKLKLVEKNNWGCMDSMTIDIQIDHIITPLITGDTLVCQGTKSKYMLLNNFNLVKSWEVSNGKMLDSATGTEFNILWNKPGTGIIKITQRDTLTGCWDTASIKVTVNPRPDVTITGDTLVCPGDVHTYITPKDAQIIQWVIYGGSSIDKDPTDTIHVVWQTADSIKVIKFNSYDCPDSSVMVVKLKPDYVDLQIGTVEADIDDTIEVPVTLDNTNNVDTKGLSVKAKLYYNNTLLEPLDFTPEQSPDAENESFINLDLPLEPDTTTGIITKLRFRTKFGDDTTTPLTLKDVVFDAGFCMRTIDGQVSFPRLTNIVPDTGRAFLKVLPNPNDGNFTLFINTLDTCYNAKIYMVSLKGDKVFDIYYGKLDKGLRKMAVSTKLVAGAYFIVFKAENINIVEKVIIIP